MHSSALSSTCFLLVSYHYFKWFGLFLLLLSCLAGNKGSDILSPHNLQPHTRWCMSSLLYTFVFSFLKTLLESSQVMKTAFQAVFWRSLLVLRQLVCPRNAAKDSKLQPVQLIIRSLKGREGTGPDPAPPAPASATSASPPSPGMCLSFMCHLVNHHFYLYFKLQAS